MGIVYKVTNIINNKIYIGKTVKDLAVRRKQHESNSNKPKYRFHYAIKKYGKENFIWEIIYRDDSELKLYLKESELISKYDSRNINIGYNMVTGIIQIVHDVINDLDKLLEYAVDLQETLFKIRDNKELYGNNEQEICDCFIGMIPRNILFMERTRKEITQLKKLNPYSEYKPVNQERKQDA